MYCSSATNVVFINFRVSCQLMIYCYFVQAQIFNQLEFLGNDNHPDAHACRLKLSAVTVGLGDSSAMKCPWSVFEEMR